MYKAEQLTIGFWQLNSPIGQFSIVDCDDRWEFDFQGQTFSYNSKQAAEAALNEKIKEQERQQQREKIESLFKMFPSSLATEEEVETFNNYKKLYLFQGRTLTRNQAENFKSFVESVKDKVQQQDFQEKIKYKEKLKQEFIKDDKKVKKKPQLFPINQ